MANVNTKYVRYDHSGSGVRHHHFTMGTNIITETNDNYPGTTDNNPGTHTCSGWTDSPDGSHTQFLFMAVTGNIDNNHLLTSPGNQTILVGAQNVNVLVVYGPQGGPGGGGPGVWVDAFNLDSGAFSDDLHFITVLTPPTPPDNIDNTKTNFANSDGEISTSQAEHIRASQTIDGTAKFIEWKNISDTPAIINSNDADLKNNESDEIWLAFYKTPPTPPPLPYDCAQAKKDLENLQKLLDGYNNTKNPSPAIMLAIQLTIMEMTAIRVAMIQHGCLQLPIGWPKRLPSKSIRK